MRNIWGAAWCGVVLAGATTASAQTVHIVNQTGDGFVPADITIQQGDSVRWVWSSGLHTVTHGAPCSTDPNPLFDAPLDTNHRTFEFQFNTPGVVPYICRFHCAFMDMFGSVTVEGGGGGCSGDEAIDKTPCKNRNGENILKVKLTGAPGDTFDVTISNGDSKSGTINSRGKGKAKFRPVPSGGGTATATFGCGAEVSKDYSCP